MNHLIPITAKKLLLAALFYGLASTPLFVYAESSTTAINNIPISATFSIGERYVHGIENLTREITATKAHRTALALRMDGITGELDTLHVEKKSLLTDKTHPVAQQMESIDDNIDNLEKQIKERNNLYHKQKLTLQQMTQPSLLADALGSHSALKQHRLMAFQKYLLHQSKNVLAQSHQKQQQLLSRKVAMTLKSRELQSNINDFQHNALKLKQDRRALETKFSELSSTIVRKQDRLEQLKQRMAELQKQPEKAHFSYYQGQLTDPTTEGMLQHRYAEPKAKGLLRWEGITVATPTGQTITAVFDGTVVFADHMQGLGYVAIVDHGEGYMSLYGMADFLIVEAGQIVLRGEPIGTAGGYDKNGQSTLYFEIRHNAGTLNPQDWLAFRHISSKFRP